MTTARALLTRAMRKGKIIGKTQTPTANELNDAFEELNSMLSLWSNDNLMIYARVLESFTLTPGDGQYTIGASADFNTTRPLFIASAFIRDAGTDNPVEVITEESYARIANKSQTGMPENLTYDNAYPLGTIRLDTLPAAAYSLYLWSEKPLTSIATLDTALSLPPGWEDTIMYNITVRLGPEFGKDISPIILKLATEGKAALQQTVTRNRSMDWDTPAPQGNILTGYQ